MGRTLAGGGALLGRWFGDGGEAACDVGGGGGPSGGGLREAVEHEAFELGGEGIAAIELQGLGRRVDVMAADFEQAVAEKDGLAVQ